MKLVRTLAFSLSLVSATVSLTLLAAGCAGTVEQPQTAGTTKQPLAVNTHGMVKVFGDAFADVPLRADQRVEIEKLASEAEARHAPMADTRKDLMLAFADQVEKGAVDKTALQPKIDKMTADFEKSRVDDRAALSKLHGILDAQQRGAFVDALEKQMKAKHGDRGEHMREGFGKLKQLSDDLKLTDDQKSQIKDAIHDAHKEGKEAWKQHAEADQGSAPWMMGEHPGKKTFDAFREDSFDLDKVAPKHDIQGMAHFGTDRVSNLAVKVLPILTPDQRKIAADKIRTMAASGDTMFMGH